MHPIKTILHATDFSEHSQCAFHLACALARDYSARLVALHVLAPPVVVYGEGVLPVVPVENQDLMRERLQSLATAIADVQVDDRLAEGDAANEILRVAKETNCDLIVLGTHGRKGLGRLLMGSVAEQVLRRATCPVLTAKATPKPAAKAPVRAASDRELAAAK
jgi:nucleotide-binding universal stress UspA family protein